MIFSKKKNMYSTNYIKKLCQLINVFPLEYKGAFLDIHIMDIFKRLENANLKRLIYVNELIFKHEHYRVTGHKPDDTYLSRDNLVTISNFVHFLKEEKRFYCIKRLYF